MKITIYRCDRCGKEIHAPLDALNTNFNEVWWCKLGCVDLCSGCHRELERHVIDFIEGGKDGKKENSTN